MRKKSWKSMLAFALAFVMFASALPVSYVNAGNIPEAIQDVEDDATDKTISEEDVKTTSGNDETTFEEESDEATSEEEGDETTSEEESDEATSEEESDETTSEEETDEVTSEEEQDVSMDEELQEDTTGEKTYEIDTTLGYTISDITSTAGAYHAGIQFKSESYIDDYYLTVVYSVSENAIPTESSITQSELNEKTALKQGELENYDQQWHSSNTGFSGYIYSGDFMGEEYLNPNTTYYYRLAYKSYDYSTYTNNYKFLSDLQILTTTDGIINSQVTVSDVTAETGYGRAKVGFKVNNPAEEYIPEVHVKVKKADGTETTAYAYEESDKEDYYYAYVNFDKETELTLAAQVIVLTGEIPTKGTVSGEEIKAQPKEFKKPEMTVKPGIQNVSVDLVFENFYDEVESLNLCLKYKLPGDEDYKSATNSIYDAKTTVNFSSLSLNPATTYEYQIMILPYGYNDKEEDKLCDYIGTFTTKELITYEDSTFPDEQFRNYLKAMAQIAENENLTNAHLEKIRNLTRDLRDVEMEQPIKSIEGIQYLENLKEIAMVGQDIADISRLAELKNLKSVNMDSNLITTLPDLSELPELYYLELGYNKLSVDSLKADNLPAKIEDKAGWISRHKETQSLEKDTIIASKYYQTGTAHPFMVGLKNYRERNYTVSVTLGDSTLNKTYSVYTGNPVSIVTFEDMGCSVGTYDVKVKVTDQFGNVCFEETKSVIFTDELASPVTEMISPISKIWGSYFYMNDVIEKDDISYIQLCDKEGNVQATTKSDNLYCNNIGTYSSDGRYEGVFEEGSVSPATPITQVSATFEFNDYLKAGKYDVKICMADDKIHVLTDVLEVTNKAVIKDVWSSYGGQYDSAGDYVYVIVDSSNLNPEKIQPALYSEDTAVTEYESFKIDISDGTRVVYKLKKLQKDTYWPNKGAVVYEIKWDADDGYDYIDVSEDTKAYFYFDEELNTLYEYYNYKKTTFDVYFPTTVADGTEIKLQMMNGYGQESDVVEATALGTVKDGMIAFHLTDSNGAVFEPQDNSYKKIIYTNTATEETYEKQLYIEWHNYSGHSYSYTPAQNTNMNLTQYEGLKKYDLHFISRVIQNTGVFTAQITDADGKVIGDAVTLSAKAGKLYQYDAVELTGTWTSSEGLTEGLYNIEFMQDSAKIYTYTLSVYKQDKFYMSSQSAEFDTDFESTDYYWVTLYSVTVKEDFADKKSSSDWMKIWNDKKYDIKIYTKGGAEVTGAKIEELDFSSSRLKIAISGLSKDAFGYYAKITRNEQLGIDIENGKTYYSTLYGDEGNDTYGEYSDNWHKNVSLIYDGYDTKAYYGVRAYCKEQYPLTVKIYKTYDTDILKQFTIENPTSDIYLFTEEDLGDIPADEVYKVIVSSGTRVFTSNIGYISVEASGETINPTAVTLNKTTLNMNVGDKETLTATITPTNATNKTITWTSSDAKVATVDAKGVITAAGVGTATITATTSNGKTANCTVNVYQYSINKKEITLDITKGETETLTVSDGVHNIAPDWSSSDLSVATVSTQGVVTPIGVGTAIITASVKDGPTFTCEVTVTASVESITIMPAEVTLTKGEELDLEVLFTPASVGKNATVTWETSNAACVTVNDGHIVAVGKGEATITASYKEDKDVKKAECKVIVLGVKENLVIPTDITAITNVQAKLSDVTLPEGWTWLAPDTVLKTFAGEELKYFTAEYKEDGYATITKEIPVKVTTITKAAITIEETVLEKAAATKAKAELVITGFAADAFVTSVEWISDKENIISIKENKAEATLTAGETGSAKVKAVVTVTAGGKDISFTTAPVTVMVVEKVQPAEFISVTSADGSVKYDAKNGVYTISITEPIEAAVNLRCEAAGVTLTSSDKNVIAVGKVTAEENQAYQSILTLKKAGYVTLTATSKDAAKTETSVDIYVKEATANLSTSNITLNNKSVVSESVYIYPNEGFEVSAVDIKDSQNFVIRRVGNSDRYEIGFKDNNAELAKGTYKESIAVSLKDGDNSSTYVMDLTVKVISSEPKVTVKQVGKVNLFYTDAEGILQVQAAGNEVIKSVVLEECDYTYENGVLKVRNGGTDKAGILKITLEGYRKPVEKKVTVKTENKAPKITLSAKSATLYPNVGITTARVSLKNTTTGQNIPANAVTVTYKNNAAAYKEAIDANGITFTRTDNNFAKAATAIISVQEANYTKAVTLNYSLKVNTKQPTLVLSNKKLTLNKNSMVCGYESAVSEVMVKDAATAKFSKIAVAAANAAAQAEIDKSMVFTVENGQIKAQLNNCTNTKAASYKFNVFGTLENGTTIKAPLTVKIVDKAPQACVTLSAKGSIDVLNRDTTQIVYTPKISNMSGTIKEVQLKGNAANLFEAELEDGKIVLKAKPDANLITKYNYELKMQLTMDNGNVFDAKVVKVKLTQSKPKTTVNPKQGTIFNNVKKNTIPFEITATNKDGSKVNIKSIKLVNFKNVFSYEDGKITLENRGKVAKGKTYSLKFEVRYEGCADNEKATTITYKVKVN